MTKKKIQHVLPGENCGDTSWSEQQNAFEKQEILRQVMQPLWA